ncbi:SusC/RagA family TonB-linked outer membrane protein [Mucilaginibacter lacusdianchii]|uniref:SusC/RagA family TonB-linked outer membrane protein n=1 Tax=Mucilaginibacter lacusdianchii TaxID=2684211 RepID=UPI00131B565B|nr:TonB-dependent receptor [Mucilaginibacter sp. JXJ CY 39]
MKRIYSISLLALLLTFFYDAAFAQNVTVSGKVTDVANGQPLIGVSVGVRGTTTGAQTDADGNYRLSVPANVTLTFTYVGYVTQSLPVGSNTTLDVKLAAQVNDLQQVVVVGYGTQRKVDVTGAVATVKGEELAKQSSPNAVSALQGKVAGVNIVNNGAPGSSPQVTIRGTGTVYGNTNVLYVVDGVWYNDINFLNPQDIDNISVLKDASSTAIYGIRASNGVIIVTTKRGRKGKTTINYNGYVGLQKVTNQVKMADATEYATAINELTTTNGSAAVFANPASFGAGTDWYKQILRTAFTTNHQLSVNGGGEKSDYNVSLGVLDQDGIVETNSYKRYTLSLSNNITPLKNLDFGVKLNGSYSRSRDVNNTIFHQLFGAAPVVPIFNDNGTYGDPDNGSLGFRLGGGSNYNPQATIDFYNQRTERYSFTGNVYAQLTFLKNFKFRTSFGGEFTNNQNTNYTPVYRATNAQLATQSSLSRYRGETRNWIAENTLTYDNRFGDHKVTVLLGQTAQREQLYAYTLSALNVPAGSESSYFSLGTAASRNIDDAGSTLNTFASYFGRINYSFKDRYLLNASLRRDGASQFFGNGTYRNLPAVGAGWVISQENFMKDQKVFDALKLRASWGRVANAGVPFNLTIPSTTTVPAYVAIFGAQQNPFTGTSISSVIPPFIVAEVSEGTDIGLEGTMFDNHLSFDLDYYNRTSKGAVFAIPIPASVGSLQNSIYGNQADIRNRGAEAAITWRSNSRGDFNYSIGGNIGYNQNKVLKIYSTLNTTIYNGGTGLSNGALATRTMEGRPIGEFYGYQVAGIFQNAGEVTASAQPNAKPGDFRYVDTNGDGTIDGKDRVVLGNPNPRFNYGINTNFTYKSFDLTLDFQGVAGAEIYNTNLAYRFGNENFTKDFYDNRWHGEGTSNKYPSVNLGTTSNSAPNSFYVSSASYFRVRNMQLGYTLPSNIASKLKMQRLRIYANAQNAINIFGYKGFSPEVGGTPTNAGLDANVYPLFATYNFGVNVTF